MELRVLEYFLALAREGSVSAAAEALHVSQPTLSRQLIELERELGTTLFERGRHGAKLTEDGMLLRRRAAEIVDLANAAKSEIAHSRGAVAGEVRIGCAETRAMDLLAGAMRALHAEHPQVTYRVVSGVAEDVVERIDRGLLDFGLLLRRGACHGLDMIRLPSNESVGIVARDGDGLVRGPDAARPLAPADLASVPLIVPESYAESGLLGGERPRSEGGRLDVVATYTLFYNAARMVRAGLGCAVALAGLAGVSPASGLVWRPLDVRLDMPSYLAWKPQLRTRACEAFLETARRLFGGAGCAG